MKYKINWAGLADSRYYHHIAKFCLPSWKKLPGKKFIIHDAEDIKIDHLEIIDWNQIPNRSSKFLGTDPSKKTYAFWRKMQSQVWAVKNLADCDFLILLDTDIEVLEFDEEKFNCLIEQFDGSKLCWATGQSQLGKLDAGFIIINMSNDKISTLIDYYENIWEDPTLLSKLPKKYDGDAVESMFPIYPSFRIRNRDYGKGLHVYEVGLVHWGSKLPKELRANWDGDGISLLKHRLENMEIKKTKKDLFNT